MPPIKEDEPAATAARPTPPALQPTPKTKPLASKWCLEGGRWRKHPENENDASWPAAPEVKKENVHEKEEEEQGTLAYDDADYSTELRRGPILLPCFDPGYPHPGVPL